MELKKISCIILILFVGACSKNISVPLQEMKENSLEEVESKPNTYESMQTTLDYDPFVTLESLLESPYIFKGNVVQRNEALDLVKTLDNDERKWFQAYDVQVSESYKGTVPEMVTIYLPYAKIYTFESGEIPQQGVNVIDYKEEENQMRYTIKNPLFKQLNGNEEYVFFIDLQVNDRYIMYGNHSIISLNNGMPQLYNGENSASAYSEIDVWSLYPNNSLIISIPQIDYQIDEIKGLSEVEFIDKIKN